MASDEKTNSIIGLPRVHNPSGSTWGEFADLSAEDAAIMAPILSPRAFIRVIGSEQTFEHLLAIHNQRFADTPIFVAEENAFQRLKKSVSINRYAPHFAALQEIMRRNQQTLHEALHIKRALKLSDLANLSMGFPRDSAGKVTGYTTFLRFTDPENLGDERLFAFFHTPTRKTALLLAQPHLLDAAMRFINTHSVTLPFDKVCAWCGRADEAGLKKCPSCRRTRYCGAECQRRHWGAHRLECSAMAAK